MLQAGIEALFGRNRDHHRKRHYFRRVRRHQPPRHHTSEDEELAKLFLDEPQTKKELLHGPTFAFGAMQGWRATMEDKHKHLIPFDSSSWKLWSYFALFDGHNGLDAAKNSADHLHVRLLESLNEMLTNDESNRTKPGHAVRSSTLDIEHLKTAIKKTYFQLDQDLREMVKDDSGCVCITCLVGPEQIFLINIGDSRAIIFSRDARVLAFTEDHKPDDPNEQERIHEAGGTISKTCDGDVLRVESQLAMTRVLGDFSLDKQIVPPMADIVQYPRESSAAFVLLACDGVWDVMSNEDVASFVCHRQEKHQLEAIVSQLLDECLQRKSTDNISIYLLKLE